MRFSTIITSIALVCASTTSLAGNTIEPYEAAVGAEAIVRQVLTSGLLKGEDVEFKSSLRKSLEGAGRSSEQSTITSMVCDRALGSDLCVITIVNSVEDGNENEGSSFELHTTLRQGRITSAKIENFIG